jgi:hypothetical protein
MPHFLEFVSELPEIKPRSQKIPHIKLEFVDLCGVGPVGGIVDPHRLPDPKKIGTLLDKPPFLALKRCVVNYFSSTVCPSRYIL